MEIVENKLVFVVDVVVGEEEVFSGGRDGVVGDSANFICNRVNVLVPATIDLHIDLPLEAISHFIPAVPVVLTTCSDSSSIILFISEAMIKAIVLKSITSIAANIIFRYPKKICKRMLVSFMF
ncbi:hypothetical protein FEM48_Zijuj10G0019700 [Ziziphus jujuba var. spinosa]|uniref:Uncharacterized protein n=1 Tax=Ziziphus jujuba var. spinosa TaxID=714518 RepID=A0A978UKM2_ZIZJJ|nr:hypothetical protein FEM48_Zijuj10G0019700 [Ziziphus jujuba var. spinosa]